MVHSEELKKKTKDNVASELHSDGCLLPPREPFHLVVSLLHKWLKFLCDAFTQKENLMHLNGGRLLSVAAHQRDVRLAAYTVSIPSCNVVCYANS